MLFLIREQTVIMMLMFADKVMEGKVLLGRSHFTLKNKVMLSTPTDMSWNQYTLFTLICTGQLADVKYLGNY